MKTNNNNTIDIATSLIIHDKSLDDTISGVLSTPSEVGEKELCDIVSDINEYSKLDTDGGVFGSIVMSKFFINGDGSISAVKPKTFKDLSIGDYVIVDELNVCSFCIKISSDLRYYSIQNKDCWIVSFFGDDKTTIGRKGKMYAMLIDKDGNVIIQKEHSREGNCVLLDGIFSKYKCKLSEDSALQTTEGAKVTFKRVR